jgi:maltose O-acetyltransferase
MSLLLLFNSVNRVLPMGRLEAAKSVLLRAGGLRIGKSVSIGRGVQFFGSNVKIGSDSWIGIGCTFYSHALSSISIGARCDIGPEVCFVTGSHKIGGPARRAGEGVSSPISVEDGTWIGCRCTILGGSTIASGSIVGAASLVLRGTTHKDSVYVGVPVRRVRSLSGGL